mmetsp:Transcript_15781/g.24027  ORF Transcript_15781/g.24027 Transcript_15781/m.24027 type:complete len:221 (-) Transcript_15781:285-947(-)
MGTIVGMMGVIPLSVHTIPAVAVSLTFNIPLSIGNALSVRLGKTLPVSVPRAIWLSFGTYIFGLLVLLMVCASLDIWRESVLAFFTNEAVVKEGCEEIWPDVVAFIFHIGIFALNLGISNGLGKQMVIGAWTVIFLWILGLPLIYYTAIVQGGGLTKLWHWLYLPYLLVNIIMSFNFIFDWEELGKEIRIREKLDSPINHDETNQLTNDEKSKQYGSIQV